VYYPGDKSPLGPADTCGVKHLRIPLYWSRCQSPCADSTCTDCCTGRSTGDLDGDGLVGMGDLTILIDFLFITLQPLACPTAGNMDLSQDGYVGMGDLTMLIDHLFQSQMPLPPCPY
jgi:hypothetical protein